jgi:STE24 endopeptidase
MGFGSSLVTAMQIPQGKKATWTLLCLTLVAIVAQVVPFLLFPVSGATQGAGVTLPPNYPVEYTPVDFAKAHTLDSALFWGGLMLIVTNVLALVTLLHSGINERIGAVSAPKLRAWRVRIFFLVAIFLCFELIGLPVRYCRFQHFKAFGLSVLTGSAWAKLVLAGLAIPLIFFVLKYLLVTCTLPLCKRLWWVAAAVGLFLIVHGTPEIISRTYPVDPIENLHPLTAGPHFDAMKRLLGEAGLNLPVMVVDQSHRSKDANICLTGRAGREYVLMTDTFAQDYTPEEVTLALAHELGHFRRKTTSMLIEKSNAFLLLLLSFWLAFLLSGRRALPVSSAPRVVVLTMICSVLASFALAPISLALSRHEERLADHYALELTGNAEVFGRLLLKVAQHELQPLDLPLWRYYLGASHPTFLERIAEANAIRAQSGAWGGQEELGIGPGHPKGCVPKGPKGRDDAAHGN